MMPEIPADCRITTDGEDDEADDDENDEEDKIDNNQTAPVSKGSHAQCTTTPPQNRNECKSSSQQCVENNRKDIVEAGHKLKTLRAMKVEKRKKKCSIVFHSYRSIRRQYCSLGRNTMWCSYRC